MVGAVWGLKQPACGEREGVSHGGIGVIRWWGRCGGSMQQHHQLLHISHLISLRIVEARGDEEGMTVHTYTQPRVEARGGGVQKGRAWDCPALPPPPPRTHLALVSASRPLRWLGSAPSGSTTSSSTSTTRSYSMSGDLQGRGGVCACMYERGRGTGGDAQSSTSSST